MRVCVSRGRDLLSERASAPRDGRVDSARAAHRVRDSRAQFFRRSPNWKLSDTSINALDALRRATRKEMEWRDGSNRAAPDGYRSGAFARRPALPLPVPMALFLVWSAAGR